MRAAISSCCTAMAFLAGCISEPAPERVACPTARTTYIVDHGDHTSLIVTRRQLLKAIPALSATLPEGPYVEIGWGDARYYPARDPGLGLTLRAALWPTASVLHLFVWPEPPMQYYDESELIPVALSEAGHHKLLDFIADTFQQGEDGTPQRVQGQAPGHGSFYYAAHGDFHLFNTCNTWIARALAHAGRPISPRWVITAGDLVSRLREITCRTAPADPAPAKRVPRRPHSLTRSPGSGGSRKP